MPDRDAGPRTTTGPNPAGERAPDSPQPGGAVVGEAGIGDAVAPQADLGGEGDLGRDRIPGAEEGEAPDDDHPDRGLPEDAAMGTPEEEAHRGRPTIAPD